MENAGNNNARGCCIYFAVVRSWTFSASEFPIKIDTTTGNNGFSHHEKYRRIYIKITDIISWKIKKKTTVYILYTIISECCFIYNRCISFRLNKPGRNQNGYLIFNQSTPPKPSIMRGTSYLCLYRVNQFTRRLPQISCSGRYHDS